MSIEIQPRKSSRIRAAADADPALTEAAIARQLGLRPVEVRNTLRTEPKRRIKSTAR